MAWGKFVEILQRGEELLCQWHKEHPAHEGYGLDIIQGRLREISSALDTGTF